MGIVKAAVFPVPVCAIPNMSFPNRAKGIAFSCIRVGFLYPFLLRAFKIGSTIDNSLNVINKCCKYCTDFF